ncbi:MAG: CPXCG motif-containing cysteine-rich protein [Verrucomicrobia bacterium]|nr:CPXCG motif-containing cysteine-rich protein [Verrucomicrobiota bacterium]
MDLQQTVTLTCPYCGGAFTTIVDTSQGDFSTIEDCQVCCRPLQIDVECAPGGPAAVEVQRA